MDNVAHALAGCLLAAAAVESVERREGAASSGFRRAAVIVGLVAAELPDADLFYSGAWLGMGKLGYMLHHRGHTHTVLFAVASAVFVWALALALRRDLRAPPRARVLLLLSLAGSVSHVALDYTNSYGVHPWWPLDNRWIYGDAVFIVEPWLWIAALPPLLFVARGVFARVLFSLLLVGILAAAWRVDMVGNGVAAALTIGAVLWTATVRAAPASRRVALGLGAWLGLEAMFFTASGTARRAVVHDVGPSLKDVVLSPSPGNPLCMSAIVVTEDAGIYRATRASVAPAPGWRNAAACPLSSRGLRNGERGERADSPAIRWGATWSAPIAELRDLAATNCEVAAALRFIRVPIWRRMGDGGVELSDLRYGEGGESFASIVARTGALCPGPVPGWEWPRNDVLRTPS